MLRVALLDFLRALCNAGTSVARQVPPKTPTGASYFSPHTGFRLAERTVGFKGFNVIDLRKEEGKGGGKGFHLVDESIAACKGLIRGTGKHTLGLVQYIVSIIDLEVCDHLRVQPQRRDRVQRSSTS